MLDLYHTVAVCPVAFCSLPNVCLGMDRHSILVWCCEISIENFIPYGVTNIIRCPPEAPHLLTNLLYHVVVRTKLGR